MDKVVAGAGALDWLIWVSIRSRPLRVSFQSMKVVKSLPRQVKAAGKEARLLSAFSRPPVANVSLVWLLAEGSSEQSEAKDAGCRVPREGLDLMFR